MYICILLWNYVNHNNLLSTAEFNNGEMKLYILLHVTFNRTIYIHCSNSISHTCTDELTKTINSSIIYSIFGFTEANTVQGIIECHSTRNAVVELCFLAEFPLVRRLRMSIEVVKVIVPLPWMPHNTAIPNEIQSCNLHFGLLLSCS